MDDIELNGAAEAGAESPALSLEEALSKTMEEAFEAATTDAPEQSRDPSGRFSQTNPPAGQEAAPQEAAPAGADQNTDQKPQSEAPAQPASNAPPASWSATAKAEWAKLPPAIQQEVLKREGDVQKGFEQRAQEIKRYERLDHVLGPRRDAMVQHYGSEAAAIETLLQAWDQASRDPMGFIQAFAQQRGINLSTATQPAADTYVDPQLASVQQQVQQLQTIIQSQQQAAVRAEQESIADQIARFKADPSNQHFDAVRADMAALIQAGRATDLKTAYDMAVWARPDIRNALLEQQEKDRQAKAQQEAADRAAAARKAAGTPLTQRGAPAATRAAPRSLEQTMAEAYDRATGA
ncbi:hypothetical protein [Azospirillum sp. sgz302134]